MKTTKPKRKPKTDIYINKDVADLIAILIAIGFPYISDNKRGLHLVWSKGKQIANNEKAS